MSGYICIAVGVLLCAVAVIWSRRKPVAPKAPLPPIDFDALRRGETVILQDDEALTAYRTWSHGICVDYTGGDRRFDNDILQNDETVFDIGLRGVDCVLRFKGPAMLYMKRLEDMTQSLRFITDPAEIEAIKRKQEAA